MALGIDVSKADFHGCLVDAGDCARHSFENTPQGYRELLRWLKKRRCQDVHACLEATGAYWLGLALALHKAKVKVSVVNPSRTALFARSQLRRTKTDLVDAEMLAQYCERQRPELWTPPAPEILDLRAFRTYRTRLVGQKTALKQLASQVPVNPTLAAIHAAQIGAITDSIAAIEDAMRKHVKEHDALRESVELVQSIKGYGFISAAYIVAQLPVDRLRNGKAVAAYAGISPRERQSGTSLHAKPRICKTGNADLRRDLYMPAMTSMRHDPAFRAFAERLRAKGKPEKVIIVAIMRKMLVLAYTLLKTKTAYNPKNGRLALDLQHGI